METEWDEALYYECAVDICSGLMAQCTAVELRAARGGDVTAEMDMAALRRDYLAELRTLEPAEVSTVTAKIREWGTALAQKIAEPEDRGPIRSDPESYRLDRDEHGAIFEYSIRPEILGELHRSRNPAAVIVAGPPATGKTTAVHGLVESWSGAEPAIIDPEMLQVYHPRSWDLVLAEDTAAAEVVMADALGWTALAVDAVIEAGSDVVLEIGTKLPDHAEAFAAVFRDCGYRVELELTMVPEPMRQLNLNLRRQCRRGNWAVLGSGPA